MALRTIDKIGIIVLAIIEIILALRLNLIGFIIGNTLLITTGVGIKLFNMYRMNPRQRAMKKERENGLAGLFC